MLTVIDEFTRRCLAIVVARKLRSDDVLHCLTDLFVAHGMPEHIRSDNGPLGYRPPAPETILPPASALPYAALRPDQMLANSGRTLT